MELCLNTLEGLLHRAPRYDLRFRIDHFGFSEKRQLKHAAERGAGISSSPFYVHVLVEQYSKVDIGSERSEVMVRGRSVLDEGIHWSFHSDAPMSPARLMLLAWAAVNRIGLSGKRANTNPPFFNRFRSNILQSDSQNWFPQKKTLNLLTN